MLVVSATDLTEGQQQQLVEATEQALRAASSAQVRAQGRKALLSGPKKRCGTDVDCLVGLAQLLKTDHALMLSLALVGAELKASAFWVDVARRHTVWRQAKVAPSASVEERARALVDAALPGFLRKGWGGVEIDADAGAIVKANGRRVATTPLEAPLALSEGTHEIDVVYASGAAVLQRVRVEEGERVQVQASFAAMPSAQTGGARSEALQTASFGLWSAGALALAGSFVAGGLARQSTASLRPCEGTDRQSCDSFATAERVRARGQALATTANWMLGVGLVFSLGGAGLYAYDALAPRPAR